MSGAHKLSGFLEELQEEIFFWFKKASGTWLPEGGTEKADGRVHQNRGSWAHLLAPVRLISLPVMMTSGWKTGFLYPEVRETHPESTCLGPKGLVTDSLQCKTYCMFLVGVSNLWHCHLEFTPGNKTEWLTHEVSSQTKELSQVFFKDVVLLW